MTTTPNNAMQTDKVKEGTSAMPPDHPLQWQVKLAEAVAMYERDFGQISEQELAAQVRSDRESAVVVRGRRRKKRSSKAPSP